MRSSKLPSQFKPIYANLLRIGIPDFLLTQSFEHLMIENDWDHLWDECIQVARISSNATILLSGYTGYVEDALGYFIGAVGSAEPNILFSFIHKILATYLKCMSSSFDLNTLRTPLITAGYQEENIDSLLTELQTLKASVSNTQNEAQQIDNLTNLSLEIPSAETSNALDQVIQLCSRFHMVARQFRRRHQNRPTLDVTDEYDVQDLLHGLLRIFFDDVRDEEYTPSYASKATRMDFLLKREEIVIEVKMTRKGLSDKEVADQLILDIERYRSHPNCKTLVCFVYDPEGRIANPNGLQADLNGDKQGLEVMLLIAPNPH
ncbi:MAG: hypothetical protein QNJ36_22520 [Calothrix sp. MO_167.B42]|nr:hypothetical protein [Calothrix sp. MO_167.B42]